MAEPEGFREFVDTHSRALLRAGWLLTGDWTSAEDLVQTALAAAWRRWDRAAVSPEGYVRAIMTTTYLGWRRRRWVGERPTESLPEEAGSDAYAEIDARHAVLDCLAVLSRQQRAAVVLRYFADLSEAQTAATMGCSVGGGEEPYRPGAGAVARRARACRRLRGGVTP